MKFMRTYIAPMTMALLIATTDLSAASAGAGGHEEHAHSAARTASVPGQEWNGLQLAGIFTGINRDKLDAAVAAVMSRADLTPVHDVISMMQTPVSADEIRSSFHKNLHSTLTRLKQGPEASVYFNTEAIQGIATSFSPSSSAETIATAVFGIVAAAPLSGEAKDRVRDYLTNDGLLLRYLNGNVEGAQRLSASATSEHIKSQIAYSLVSQVALGDQAIAMQIAGDYKWFHEHMPLEPTVLNPVRNTLWQIFVDTGFVTTGLGSDISGFVYNPAAALKSYLDANPLVREIVIACGNIPVNPGIALTPKCDQFFGSMECPHSHAGQITMGLDYRDRPNVFANALMPGLFDLVGKGRIDRVIIEAYSVQLEAPAFVSTLRAALGDDVQIFKDAHGEISPL